MAYDSSKPANDGFLADFPPEMREQLRAIIEDKIVNAGKLNGLTPSNAAGKIAINNGTVNANLNADKLDGKDSTYFSPATHTHSAATTSSNGLMAAADKIKLDGIATGAEVNQNAFGTVKVGQVNIQAGSVTDTLNLDAGTNIQIEPDVANDKVTISAPNALDKRGDKMTGPLTVNTAVQVAQKFTGKFSDISVTPVVNELQDFFQVEDSTGRRLFFIRVLSRTDNKYTVQFITTGAENGAKVFLECVYNKQSNTWNLLLPKNIDPQANGKEVVNARWVKALLSAINYLPLSGGTMTGELNLKNTNYTFEVDSVDGGTIRTRVIQHGTANQYGINVGFGSGGNTVVGGGESAQAQLNALDNNFDENVYVVADGDVILRSNLQTGVSAAKEIVFKSNGELWVNGAKAILTDTKYGLATTSAAGLIRQLSGNTGQYLQGDGNWGTPPNTNNIVAQSLGVNGYTKFSNGLIIQWGAASFALNENKTITFPQAFYDTNYSLVVDDSNSGLGPPGYKTKTSFRIYADGSLGEIMYIVVGRWK